MYLFLFGSFLPFHKDLDLSFLYVLGGGEGVSLGMVLVVPDFILVYFDGIEIHHIFLEKLWHIHIDFSGVHILIIIFAVLLQLFKFILFLYLGILFIIIILL